MSGAIVKAAYAGIGLLGWDYGNQIPDLKDYDQVVMVDISFPREVMKSISSKLIWIDHHISAIKDIAESEPLPFYKGLRNEKKAACELTWEYFFEGEKMPEIVRLLGRYDCFGHKGTDEEQKVLEFQFAARTYLKNLSDCYQMLKYETGQIAIPSEMTIDNLLQAGKGIYKFLCTEAEQAYANRFTIRLDGRLFACVNKERFNPINFGINYHNDGYHGFACFWYANGKYNYSLYNDNGEVDCSEIAKRRGGGGHKGASGFIAQQIITN